MENIELAAAAIFKITRSMREQIGKSKVLGSLSVVQIRTLAIIDEKKHPTMKEIADELCVTSPSATRVIERLVRTGELKREPDPKDRRIIRLCITTKGEKILQSGLREAGKKMKDIVTSLSAKEKKDFMELIKKVASHI